MVTATRADLGAVEHELVRHATDVALLAGGALVLSGPPSELFGAARYFTLAVASGADALRAALAQRGLSLAGGPRRYAVRAPAGSDSRAVLAAIAASSAVVTEVIPLFG